MGFESYISESEASVLAGVGVTTLRRFAEAGYFKVETESDGLKLYARSDLERVFGVKSKPVPAQPIPQFPSAQSFQSQPFQSWTPPKTAISPESNGSPEGSGAEAVAEISEEIPAPAEVKAEPVPSGPMPPAPEKAPVMAAPQPAQPQLPPQQLAAIDMLDRELSKQRTISEMHERLICIREEEIRSLKDEREWLRARIEKLEEKAARDQILLLSETQTIKTLIAIQEQRRSPVRLALEWLGLVPPASVEQAPRSAIDVTEKSAPLETKKAA